MCTSVPARSMWEEMIEQVIEEKIGAALEGQNDNKRVAALEMEVQTLRRDMAVMQKTLAELAPLRQQDAAARKAAEQRRTADQKAAEQEAIRREVAIAKLWDGYEERAARLLRCQVCGQERLPGQQCPGCGT